MLYFSTQTYSHHPVLHLHDAKLRILEVICVATLSYCLLSEGLVVSILKIRMRSLENRFLRRKLRRTGKEIDIRCIKYLLPL